MLTITFSTSGDIDPIKLNNYGSRNPIFDIPGAQTLQFEQLLCNMLNNKKRIREAPRLTSVKLYIILFYWILNVFAQNTRMSPFIMFSLSRMNGTLLYAYAYAYAAAYASACEHAIHDKWREQIREFV